MEPDPNIAADTTEADNVRKTSKKKSVWGWAFYDWANSAFATTVMAGFFPIFFKQYWSSGTDISISTAQLGFGNSIASLFVAIIAPVLGAVADIASARKKMLIFFAYVGVLMTGSLFWVQQGQWLLAIFIYGFGIIGFSGSIVFYDSLLPSIASEKEIDKVSSLGYACGYLGGGLLFLLNVMMTLMPQRFGLPDPAAAVRWSFLTVALWWGGFTLFTLRWVQEVPAPRTVTGLSAIMAGGFRQYTRTFKEFRHLKTILLFLLAYWFYIDGVDTIIRMAVDYGLSLGFNSNDLILALLMVQFIGFPCALLFGILGRRWGPRKAIYLAIGMYVLITFWGTMITNKMEFYGLALLIGMVQGGIQALSRSYYSRIIPKNRAAEYYGFYNMLGKFATILGPALMASVVLIVKDVILPSPSSPEEAVQFSRLAARVSMGSVALLFIIGGVLLYFVDEAKGRQEAAYLSR